jgi:hypothetical protein
LQHPGNAISSIIEARSDKSRYGGGTVCKRK